MIRLATAKDAANVATIQVRGWHAAYAGIMPGDYLATVGFLSPGPARDTDLKGAGFQEYRKVSLWVLEANRIARHFYEKLGFAHDGHTAPYQAGDRRLVALRYVHGL